MIPPVLPPGPGGTFQHFQIGNYALNVSSKPLKTPEIELKMPPKRQIFLQKVLPPAPPQTAKCSPPDRGGLRGGVAPPQPISCGGETPPQNKSPPPGPGGDYKPLHEHDIFDGSTQ